MALDTTRITTKVIHHAQFRQSGYTLTEHGLREDIDHDSASLDDLLCMMLSRIAPLGDGMRRLAALRDAIDSMLEIRGRELLKLPKKAGWPPEWKP